MMKKTLSAGLLLSLVALLLAAGAEARRVTIKNKDYHPATLTVKVGQTVEWHNEDDRDHTVTADDNAFKSGNISAGQSFTHRFTKAGEYPYNCAYHPRMKGKVIVEE